MRFAKTHRRLRDLVPPYMLVSNAGYAAAASGANFAWFAGYYVPPHKAAMACSTNAVTRCRVVASQGKRYSSPGRRKQSVSSSGAAQDPLHRHAVDEHLHLVVGGRGRQLPGGHAVGLVVDHVPAAGGVAIEAVDKALQACVRPGPAGRPGQEELQFPVDLRPPRPGRRRAGRPETARSCRSARRAPPAASAKVPQGMTPDQGRQLVGPRQIDLRQHGMDQRTQPERIQRRRLARSRRPRRPTRSGRPAGVQPAA